MITSLVSFASQPRSKRTTFIMARHKMRDLFVPPAITVPFLFFQWFSGTKGVTKAMKEIRSGAQKWEGEKWFAELSDKRKSLQFFALHKVQWCI